MKKFPLHTSLLVLSALLLSAVAAWSQCTDPTTPSVVICTPSPGATVVYIPDVAVRFTPASGSTVTKMIIYDNGRNMWQGGAGQNGIDVYDADVFDGTHNIVVKAWDSYGNFYQAFYLNGKYQAGCSGSGCIVGITVPQQGTSYNLKAVATDSAGKTYSATKTVVAEYTYGGVGCMGNGCTPGITPIAPLDEAYVGSTFELNTQIQNNPDPISAMRAYLDSNVIATSNGPTLQQQVTVAPSGTHILTVQGWDSKGIEYRIQENININVSK